MKRIAFVLIAALALLTTAQADFEGLTLSTDYPSQVVSTGESLSIPIHLRSFNLPPQIVDVEIAEQPEGWQATLVGAGRVVQSVYLPVDGQESVTLELDVPREAPEASYDFVLRAVGGANEAELPIRLTVGEVLPAQLTMEVELPQLRGSSNSSFEYQAELTNDSGSDMVVNFEASVPEVFDVTFSRGFGGEEITALPMEAGQSQDVNIQVAPAARTPAGEYPMTVRAVGEGLTAEVELTAVVTGRPEIQVTGPEGRLSGQVTAGSSNTQEVIIQNIGTAPAEGIELNASAPSQWNVEFSPATIDRLDVEQQISVTADITPADESIAGDYMMTVRANPENGNSGSADFRLTLRTSTQWGIVGLVLIAAALGVVALAVSRFGRR